MKVSAIIPSAGSGKRLGGRTPKPLVPVNGAPLLVHTLRRLRTAFNFHEIILAVEAGQRNKIIKILERFKLKNVRTVLGGKTRAESVRNAVLASAPLCEYVLVHDVARPLASARLVRSVLAAGNKTGAAICGIPATATVKKVSLKTNNVTATLKRDELFLIQTPQVFRKEFLLKRYEALGVSAFSATDEAALFDGTGIKVKLVAGEAKNLKITTPDDLDLFQFYIKKGSVK